MNLLLQEGGGAKSAGTKGLNVRVVDPSEYEPQVVDLSEATIVEPEEHSDTRVKEAGSAEETGSGAGSPANSGELSKEQRLGLWIKNLHAMQEKYMASLTEQQREILFQRLEL